MIFAIFCTDKPGFSEVRAATRAAHLEYLRGFLGHVVMAGPTQTHDGQGMNGSLLLMEFPDLATARAFADSDPYAQAGLFESVIIRPWKKVLPEA